MVVVIFEFAANIVAILYLYCIITSTSTASFCIHTVCINVEYVCCKFFCHSKRKGTDGRKSRLDNETKPVTQLRRQEERRQVLVCKLKAKVMGSW